MRWGASTRLFGVMLTVAVFIASPFTVAAVDRVSGQFWTYDASMMINGSNATGTISYSLSGRDTLESNGTSYDADVLTITGNLSSTSSLFGTTYSLRSTVGGTRHVIAGGMAAIQDDMGFWTDMSVGSPPSQLLARVRTESILNYSPPYLLKFDPATARPGDSWRETITLSTTTIVNGTAISSAAHRVTYSVVISSSTEDVTVGAGTFETLRLTSTDSSGARDVLWWSSKADTFVLEKRYDPLSSTPGTIMSLREYEASTGGVTLIAILLGSVVIGVAILILVMILRARRREAVRWLPHPSSPRGLKTPGISEREPKR